MKPPTACRYLQNKTFFLAPPLETDDEEHPLATPCWCLQTHEPTGPDSDEVDVDSCTPDRTCFEPEVEF